MMNLSLTDEAKGFINEQLKKFSEKQVILIYQYSKNACSGSYLDYYVTIDKMKDVNQNDAYEQWKTLELNNEENLDVYLEKRLMDDFNKEVDVLIDIVIHKKFNDKFVELILKNKE